MSTPCLLHNKHTNPNMIILLTIWILMSSRAGFCWAKQFLNTSKYFCSENNNGNFGQQDQFWIFLRLHFLRLICCWNYIFFYSALKPCSMNKIDSMRFSFHIVPFSSVIPKRFAFDIILISHLFIFFTFKNAQIASENIALSMIVFKCYLF